VLVGGSPWRRLRLTPAGDRLVDAWSVGVAVGDGLAQRRLAGRLVDGGLAVPLPGDEPAGLAVTVVIPVRDRSRGLAETLASMDPSLDVVVVDDGSSDGAAVERAVARRPGTRLARRASAGGPAAARNTGWRTASTAEVVAFVDADCVTPQGFPGTLLGFFADPAVAAVAPRIRAVPAPGTPAWLAAYERTRSPLDCGERPAVVRPGSPVPYVPSAVLLVRRAALEAAGGFDEQLRAGEDVDLVWRLAGRVLYTPAVVADHPMRPTVRLWATQRYSYGMSAAPLAARHGARVAPAAARWPTLLAWGLVAGGRPVAGALAAGGAALVVALGTGPAATDVILPALAAQARAGPQLARALRRSWWPLALAAAAVSPRARRAVAASVLPMVGDPLRLADDLAYGAGVWAGAWRARSIRCLLPHPPPSRARIRSR
jgi:mycofactocin system glycosyltransferase